MSVFSPSLVTALSSRRTLDHKLNFGNYYPELSGNSRPKGTLSFRASQSRFESWRSRCRILLQNQSIRRNFSCFFPRVSAGKCSSILKLATILVCKPLLMLGLVIFSSTLCNTFDELSLNILIINQLIKFQQRKSGKLVLISSRPVPPYD